MSDESARSGDGLPWPGVIGMGLSGGGYRATAFHLGTLSYLHRLGLLENVRMMTAVSGATFTAAAYAISLVEKKPFGAFFRDFYRLLRDTNLVEAGFDELAEHRANKPSGRDNIILGMAEIYARRFFADAEGRPYRFGTILDADIHLEELNFSALDYRNAVAFSFQRSANSEARIGNREHAVPREDAAQIRIADIVATCTSIPGPFEPVVFPDDFDWPGGVVPEATRKRFTSPDGKPLAIPLMDGGLHDNQGIESLLLADERSPEDLDLFILSDVFREPAVHYAMPEPRGARGPTLGALARVGWLLVLAWCLTAPLIVYRSAQLMRAGAFDPVWDSLTYGVPFVTSCTLVVVFWYLRRLFIELVLSRIPKLGTSSWHYIRRLRISQAAEFLDVRVGSLIATTHTVIWKRVRNLGYRLVYGNERYEGKRISCLLRHLRPGEPLDAIPGIEPPSEEMRNAAGACNEVETTLWFDGEHQLPCLVATGQATMCYNLMKHIVRCHGREPASYPPEVAALWQRLAGDWERLRHDAYALIEEHLPGAALPRPPGASEPAPPRA